jgi:membrane associated rhomboid family serine protease
MMNRQMTIQAWPLTPAVKYIIIINSIIWILTVIAARMGYTAVFNEMALTPVLFYPGLHIWQPFTYMWVHSLGDFFHIVLNMLFLWMFGGMLEQSWGTRSFLKFYLICGIGAGLTVFITGYLFYPAVATVGASGAVYGLVAAFAIIHPERLIYLFGIFPIKGKHFALIPVGFALLDFLVGGNGISHAAHLGGLLVGALLVTGLWRPVRFKNRIRYYWLKRRLKVLDGGQNKHSDKKYWN